MAIFETMLLDERSSLASCSGVLAYLRGLINQELLLQVEYLAAENRILRANFSEPLEAKQ